MDTDNAPRGIPRTTFLVFQVVLSGVALKFSFEAFPPWLLDHTFSKLGPIHFESKIAIVASIRPVIFPTGTFWSYPSQTGWRVRWRGGSVSGTFRPRRPRPLLFCWMRPCVLVSLIVVTAVVPNSRHQKVQKRFHNAFSFQFVPQPTDQEEIVEYTSSVILAAHGSTRRAPGS